VLHRNNNLAAWVPHSSRRYSDLVASVLILENTKKTPVLFIDERHAQLSAEATAGILLQQNDKPLTLTKEGAKSASRALCWDWTNYLEENIASQKHSFGIIHPPINTETEALQKARHRPTWKLFIDYMPPPYPRSMEELDIDFQSQNWSLSAPAGSEVIRGRDVDSFSPALSALTGLPICVAASQLTPFAEIANDVKK
jgi:hypothetical protein